MVTATAPALARRDGAVSERRGCGSTFAVDRDLPEVPEELIELEVRSAESGSGVERESIRVIPEPAGAGLVSYFSNEMTTWIRALRLQLDRSTMSGPGMDQRIIESNFFAFGLRLFLRAAEEVVGLKGSNEAIAALATFKKQVPGAVHVRDITEHFNTYAKGEGKLGTGWRLPVHSWTAGSSTYFIQAFEFRDGNIVATHEIDMAQALESAERLAAKLASAP